MTPSELHDLAKRAAGPLLARMFKHGTFIFGSQVFSVDSPSPNAPRGNHCLKYTMATNTWNDAITGRKGEGLVSLVAYAKALGPKDAAAAVEAAMAKIPQADRPLPTMPADPIEAAQQAILKKKWLTPRQRADELFDLALKTRHIK